MAKYIKKRFNNIKKRYKTKGGGFRTHKAIKGPGNAYSDMRSVVKEIAFIKRSLNVEHKHIDYVFGAKDNANASTQYPTKDYPLVLPLITPIRGTSFNERVGNQIRVVHMTTKLQFIFQNNQDLTQRANVRAQIVFSKNASDVPDITQLYEIDANGHYTPLSMANTQEWDKFVFIKAHDHRKGYTQPTNRYPESQYNAITADPTDGTNMDVTTPANYPLNMATFYSNAKSKESIKITFKNLSEEVECMKPYLLLRSDVISNNSNTIKYDPVAVSGVIRMTYIDN